MKGQCPCGGVTVTVPGRPEYLNSCNCTLCFRLGTLTGYFPLDQVMITGETREFRRSDIEVYLTNHFCPTCSAVVGWTSIEPYDRMGVNMRLFDPEELLGIPIRFPNGRDDTGEGERPPHRHDPVPFAREFPF
jgi:hypothetical protein